jgi:hypothetical protein
MVRVTSFRPATGVPEVSQFCLTFTVKALAGFTEMRISISPGVKPLFLSAGIRYL